jgi:transcriptional regulator with XRE-family HTH domain
MIADKLRELRLKHGYSIDRLAAAAGVGSMSLWKIEKGRTRSPGLTTLRKLAAALEVPLTSLLEIDDVLPE